MRGGDPKKAVQDTGKPVYAGGLDVYNSEARQEREAHWYKARGLEGMRLLTEGERITAQ